jgi:hypothetical protein
VKGNGIACHGTIINPLDPEIVMAGSHVEKAGLVVNDIMLDAVRVPLDRDMVYLGIIHELGGVCNGLCALLGKPATAAKGKNSIVMGIDIHWVSPWLLFIA